MFPTPGRIASRWLSGACLALLLAALTLAADPNPGLPPVGPLAPRDEQATFRLPAGFRAELVAREPDVIDPVAMAFDEEGRIFVCEMRGYPNGGLATGTITSGRVRLLEDRDGDGFYEKSTIYADNLRFPTAVMPYKGGVLVANAPDLLYLEDSTGAGKADRQRVLYTGFNLANIQQLVNSLQWGLDNWVHGCAGSNGGTITSAEKPDLPAVTLRSRGIRFHPDVPGSLEPTSGGGQYGLAPDEFGRWFTATNSQHLRHIVLPDHYLRRQPLLPVSAVTLDIPDHGAACQVHRISPFEAWRVERTSRRKAGPDAQRFPSTELVPGGYVTSGCSPVIYTASDFPSAYRGNSFVCDPANNLIHRDVLIPNGATFTARRGDLDCEFLASTDTWFRPVHLTLGPDGAIYVLDFYREVIETPLSLPDDIKKKLNLESRGRGRIWRITAQPPEKERKALRPNLRKASSKDLVAHLAHPNQWWRLTAQRLLVERQDRSILKDLRILAAEAKTGVGRAHALGALDGLDALDDDTIATALKDADPGVREQALRLADKPLSTSAKLRAAVANLAGDPSPRVRFQLAFTLGQARSPEGTTALAQLAGQDAADPWTQTAILSSSHNSEAALLKALLAGDAFTSQATASRLQLLRRLAGLIGAGGSDAEVAKLLLLVSGEGKSIAAWQAALLEGLGQGRQLSGQGLGRLWEQPPDLLKEAVAKARGVFEQASAVSRDGKRSSPDRVAALQLLGHGPFSLVAAAAPELLTPQTPADVQLAAVRALAPHVQPRVAALLLQSWAGYSPTVRREALEALFSRPERLQQLLTAVEQKKVLPSQLEPARIEQLRKHPNGRIRERAVGLFAGQLTPDRQKVVEAYRAALELKADGARGKAVFKKTCTTCHRLENEGTEVGPDLLSALRNKSRDQLVIDILDPSREVDPRYLNYVVTTRKGQSLTGLIAAETASSITLRRGDKAEDTILRSQIEEIQATGKSVMPENLEMQLNKQDLADLIAYLQMVAVPK